MILDLDTSALVKLYAREAGQHRSEAGGGSGGSGCYKPRRICRDQVGLRAKASPGPTSTTLLCDGTSANSSATGPGSIVYRRCHNDTPCGGSGGTISLAEPTTLCTLQRPICSGGDSIGGQLRLFRRCAQRRRGEAGLEADCRRLTGAASRRRSSRRRSSHDWPRCHISRAYSATARSLENAPIRARLSIALRIQTSGC